MSNSIKVLLIDGGCLFPPFSGAGLFAFRCEISECLFLALHPDRTPEPIHIEQYCFWCGGGGSEWKELLGRTFLRPQPFYRTFFGLNFSENLFSKQYLLKRFCFVKEISSEKIPKTRVFLSEGKIKSNEFQIIFIHFACEKKEHAEKGNIFLDPTPTFAVFSQKSAFAPTRKKSPKVTCIFPTSVFGNHPKANQPTNQSRGSFLIILFAKNYPFFALFELLGQNPHTHAHTR